MKKIEETFFPPELRTAAFVPRWNIVWSTLKDNVAQHSFFVTWYAVMVAKVIKWEGPLDVLMIKALAHDLDETITGDITGPVKASILDKTKADEFLELRMIERMSGLIDTAYSMEDSVGQEVYDDIEKIVNVADMLDAVLWLQLNVCMGNRVLQPTFDVNIKKLEAKWRALPASENDLSRLWQTVMVPSIAAHDKEGGRGI